MTQTEEMKETEKTGETGVSGGGTAGTGAGFDRVHGRLEALDTDIAQLRESIAELRRTIDSHQQEVTAALSGRRG
ncbi:hypothetical protein [Streptomyces radicis]|uniref:hypothetical protein n=1 Tax=Streptomyces radicis TaxID=1750517 RepID=UPI0011C37940|nr:hypothetical protein [Streptomyces radicis]